MGCASANGRSWTFEGEIDGPCRRYGLKCGVLAEFRDAVSGLV